MVVGPEAEPVYQALGRRLFSGGWTVGTLGSHVIECVCRLCGANLTHSFVDLGMSPLCESYVPADRVDDPEVFYPLHVRLCQSCLLVQLPAYVAGEDIFSDYAYFSSYSDSWVAHAKRYALGMIERLDLSPDSLVTEVASNDGYLLQHFVAEGIPVLGVEPAANVAEAARARGMRTVVEFLGADTGREIAARWGRADLVAGNNVFAHVPDIRGFAAGLRGLVKDTGVVTLEFPHLLRLIERRQYDTIYHEHYSYLSLLTSSRALATAGLRVVDVDELGHPRRLAPRLCQARGERRASRPPGSKRSSTTRSPPGCTPSRAMPALPARSSRSRANWFASFWRRRARAGPSPPMAPPARGTPCSTIAAYGPTFSPTPLIAVRSSRGRFCPGTHIPIYPPEHLAETQPDYILVLPWNLRDEISQQLEYVRSWGGRLVFPIPELEIV